MRPRRKSKIFEIGVLLSATACGAALETAPEMKEATRHPDGVLVEPPPAIPPAEEHGSAGGVVVALRTPISDEQIGDVVHKYVRAFTEGNIEAFEDLLDDNAVLFDAGHSQPRPTLMQNLRVRYSQHVQEYRQIHDDIARLDRIERWSSDDLGPFTDPPRPVEMRKGDVLVRVPLDPQTSASTGDALFHNTLVLLLRRGSDRVLRIAGLQETDAP